MSGPRDDLAKPYWAAPDDKTQSGCPPTDDFNREIVPPGTHDKFPDGAIVIRTDDDFFIVAVLPYSYLAMSIEKIVERFWPSYMATATFNPDTTYPENAS